MFAICFQASRCIFFAFAKRTYSRCVYAVDASDSIRDQSKARTQLKNAVKKWFIGEEKNLERNTSLASLYEKYEAMLAKAGMYDFEDMISRCVSELKRNDALLAEYQEQFQYIFVVGDDKQSIYRFQGASLANMLSFYERYKNSVQIISLTENYRSQKTIIDASGALISRNAESLKAHIPGIAEELVPGKQLPEKAIDVIETESEDQEEFLIGQSIAALIAGGAKAEDIAVLYRYNADGNSLLHTLRTMNLPARVEMGGNIFDVLAVRQWMILLQWLVTGQDDLLARIEQLEWWSIDPIDALKAIHYAGKQYKSLYAVLSSKEYLMQAEVSNSEALFALANQLAQFQHDSANMSVMEFLEHVMKETGWMNRVLDMSDAVVLLCAMKRFLNEAKELASTHIGYSMQDFVRHLSFLEQHDIALLTPQWEGGVGAVHLMSAHKAKGLEWPHVFVMKMNDKHWGNLKKRAGISLPEGLVRYDFVFLNDKNEDERRLFYVALTRSMHTATLTRSAHSATGKETVPSIFLSEIPKEFVRQQAYAETPDMQQRRLMQTMAVHEQDSISEDARAYIKSQLAGYVMSVTHLNNYLDCPRKFYWRNILQVPSMKTRSLMLGSAMHDTLRDIFETLHAGKPLPKEKGLHALFKKYLQREPMDKKDFEEILSKGSKAITGYVEHYQNDFIANVMTEHNFKKYHVMIGDVPVTGKLDKIEIVDKKKRQLCTPNDFL